MVNLDIQVADIRDIFRPITRDLQKPIIAEFSSVIKKEKLISAVKNFNKGKQKGKKLNTTLISKFLSNLCMLWNPNPETTEIVLPHLEICC